MFGMTACVFFILFLFLFFLSSLFQFFYFEGSLMFCSNISVVRRSTFHFFQGLPVDIFFPLVCSFTSWSMTELHLLLHTTFFLHFHIDMHLQNLQTFTVY